MSKSFDIREYKKDLRRRYRALRRDMPPRLKAEKDLAIAAHIRELPAYQSCKTVLCYVSTPEEVDTHRLIRTALEDGKSVAVPGCVPGTRLMHFYRIRSLDELAPRTFGVLEPDPKTARRLTDFSRSLCILPGLSFDRHGYRLGYGGGYYDRFLSKVYKGGTTVGVCYHACTRPSLLHGRYDVACQLLVTENGCRPAEKPRGQRKRAPRR